jgi:hypothetical protein
MRWRSFEKTEIEAWLSDNPKKVETLKEEEQEEVVNRGSEAVIIFTVLSDCLKQNL